MVAPPRKALPGAGGRNNWPPCQHHAQPCRRCPGLCALASGEHGPLAPGVGPAVLCPGGGRLGGDQAQVHRKLVEGRPQSVALHVLAEGLMIGPAPECRQLSLRVLLLAELGHGLGRDGGDEDGELVHS